MDKMNTLPNVLTIKNSKQELRLRNTPLGQLIRIPKNRKPIVPIQYRTPYINYVKPGNGINIPIIEYKLRPKPEQPSMYGGNAYNKILPPVRSRGVQKRNILKLFVCDFGKVELARESKNCANNLSFGFNYTEPILNIQDDYINYRARDKESKKEDITKDNLNEEDIDNIQPYIINN